MSVSIERLPRAPKATLISDSWRRQSSGIFWRFIDLGQAVAGSAAVVLDDHERDRASRFRFERDRARYVAAHVALRMSLSEVLEQAPEDIKFTLGAAGKPMLAPDRDWIFNLSHSEDVAIIAVAPRNHSGEIGVDIEMLRNVPDWQSLARENFSDAECRDLATCREEDRAIAFLRCWTRKEACVKALGTGLTLPANCFTIGIGSDPVAVAIDVEGQLRDVEVRALFESNTCIAAVAYCPRASGANAQIHHSPAVSPLEIRKSSWNLSLNCPAASLA